MYYRGKVTLLLVLLLVCFQLQRNAAVDENDMANFIYSRIPELRWQARPGGREQFAALIFLDQTEVHDMQRFHFNPHNDDGTPVVNNIYSYRPAQPMNYVVARPERPDHAEKIILEQLPNMWNNYRETRGTPALILLFTRLYPCTAETPGRTRRCAENIRAVLREAPYNVTDKVLSYNSDDRIIAPDFDHQNDEFLMAGITIQALPMNGCFNTHMKRSVEDELVEHFPGTCTEPTYIQSYQGCILQRLGDDAFTCIKHDAVERQKAYLMNILVDRCLFNNQRDTCFMNTFLQNTGNACYSLQKQIFVDKLKSSLSVCSLKPISQPCQESRHFDVNIALMTSADQRTNYTPPEQFGCFNERHTGLFCSNIDDRYLTAGNSLCRSGHPCGYYDEKEYSWCYTTTNNYWDYCCSGSCGYHGYDYLWCESGNTWQYCGKGGSIATGYRTNMQPNPCLVEHQCGLHYDYSSLNNYYWCFIDAYENWDYCCSPEPDDNECTYNGGTSYKWCKILYYKTGAYSDWVKCNY